MITIITTKSYNNVHLLENLCSVVIAKAVGGRGVTCCFSNEKQPVDGLPIPVQTFII